MVIHCKSLADVEQLAGYLATKLQPGDVLLLDGDLGAGKTTFIRFLCKHWGYDQTTSPTFILVQKYPTRPKVYHLDLYRLSSEAAILMLDFDAMLDDDSAVMCIEWSEKLGTLCPDRYLRMKIEHGSEEARTITFSGALRVYLEDYVS